MKRRKKRKRKGQKELDPIGDLTPERLLAHRELELLRAGARQKRASWKTQRHLSKRQAKLDDAYRRINGSNGSDKAAGIDNGP